MDQPIETSVTIRASPSLVWKHLTDPEHMSNWMAEPGINPKVTTSWEPGTSIVITGFHHVKFKNKGTVLRFEPCSLLAYSHLSSVSHLPDKPESYTIFEFRLRPLDEQTILDLKIENFPTHTIFKHLQLYWPVTLRILKKCVEG